MSPFLKNKIQRMNIIMYRLRLSAIITIAY